MPYNMPMQRYMLKQDYHNALKYYNAVLNGKKRRLSIRAGTGISLLGRHHQEQRCYERLQTPKNN